MTLRTEHQSARMSKI